MSNIKIIDLVNLQKSILYRINPDIANHGQEVAYVVYRLCQRLKYNDKEMRDLIIASLFHDIGSFKANDMDELMEFNITSRLSHSVFGYLLFENCKILRNVAPLIIYHHYRYNERDKAIPEVELDEHSFMICLADRVSVLCNLVDFDKDEVISRINKCKEGIFHPLYREVLLELLEKEDIIEKLKTQEYKAELHQYLNKSIIPVLDV